MEYTSAHARKLLSIYAQNFYIRDRLLIKLDEILCYSKRKTYDVRKKRKNAISDVVTIRKEEWILLGIGQSRRWHIAPSA